MKREILQKYKETKSQKETARVLKISEQKVRKTLIEAGIIISPLQKKISDLISEGKSVEDVMSLLEISRSTVYTYLPYIKCMYKSDNPSPMALKLREYRNKKITDTD